VKRGEPDWSLLDLPGIKDLPAVRWKLGNLATFVRSCRTRIQWAELQQNVVSTVEIAARFIGQ
jgi:hypothetical protein